MESLSHQFLRFENWIQRTPGYNATSNLVTSFSPSAIGRAYRNVGNMDAAIEANSKRANLKQNDKAATGNWVNGGSTHAGAHLRTHSDSFHKSTVNSHSEDERKMRQLRAGR